MRIRILCSVVCLLIVFVSGTFAQELETIIEKVQEEYDQTRDIQAAFVQVALMKPLNQTKESQGIVYFKKPGKMRWEYTNPDQQLLVSDGKTMWFYVAEDSQVIIQDAQSAYGSKTPVTFLYGMGKLQNDFYIKLLPSPGDATEYKLELLPKQSQSDVAKLILSVNQATYRIVHTAVYDPYGNITDVYLQNIETNGDLPDVLFTFEVPDNVDVLRQN